MDFQKIYDNNYISLGDIKIAYYAIAIIIGMLVGLYILSRLFKTRGIEVEFAFTVFLYMIPLGILFARLGYVLPRIKEYNSFFDFINPRGGGLTITTGFLGGILGACIACKIHKKSFFRISDLCVSPLLIAQAIGRWGNFFNGELYGSVVKHDALKHFPLAVMIPSVDSNWHYALFFYEGTLNMIAALMILLYIHFYIPKVNLEKVRKNLIKNQDSQIDILYQDKIKPGVITFIYITWYCTIRSLLEFLKDPTNNVRTFPGTDIKEIQFILGLIAPIAFIFVLLIYFKKIKLESKKTKKLHFNFDKQKLLYTYHDNQEIQYFKSCEVIE